MKYNFYPFNHENCIWNEDNKAIILRTPYLDIPENKRPMFNPILWQNYYCGYVLYHKSQMPTEWFNSDRQIDLLDMLGIHGGISYKDVHGDYLVFGFDCNHAFDSENPKLQDKNYIIELINQMEQQINLHIKKLLEFRKLKTKKQKIEHINEIIESSRYKDITPNILGMFCLALSD